MSNGTVSSVQPVQLQKNHTWFMVILLIAVVVLLAGLVAMFYKTNLDAKNIRADVAAIRTELQALQIEKSDKAPLVDEYKNFNQKTVAWNGEIFQFAHRCKGEVKVGTEGSVPFCIGDNQLVVINASGDVRVLNSTKITETIDAPVFLEASLINGTKTGAVLLAYVTGTCLPSDSCELGSDFGFINKVYNLSDQILRDLANFPKYQQGEVIWNPSGTKAILRPYTCGGTGCEVAPLKGYNLLTDTIKAVSDKQAAGEKIYRESLSNILGEDLPVWKSVSWKNDNEFTAVIRNIDGSLQEISGTF